MMFYYQVQDEVLVSREALAGVREIKFPLSGQRGEIMASPNRPNVRRRPKCCWYSSSSTCKISCTFSRQVKEVCAG